MAATEAQKAAAAKWRANNPGKSTEWNQNHLGYQATKLREYRATNKEHADEVRVAWRAAHPGYDAAIALKWNHARLEKLAGRPRPKHCEVCGKSGKICFEHDHTMNKFRGWLCSHCNSALGYAFDSPDLLRKLAVYLEQCGVSRPRSAVSKNH